MQGSPPQLSERALRLLADEGCMPPGWSRQALIDWLAQNGIAHFEALIAWEQAMHDIRERQYLPRSPCKESPQGCRAGLSSALIYIHGLWCGTLVFPSRPIVIDSDGTTLVKFGQDGAGSLLYLDQAGRVFKDSASDPSRWPMAARSPFIFLERQIFRFTMWGQAELRIEGSVAERLADALGVPLLPEASDDIAQVYGDERFVLLQADPSSARARVLALGEAPRLLRAIGEIGARARIDDEAPAPKLEPRAPAPPLAEPAPGAVRLWSFGHVRGTISMEAGALVQVSGRTTEARRLIITGEGPPVEHRRCLLTEADLRDFSPRAQKYLLAMRVRRDPVEVPAGDELEEAVARLGLQSYGALRQVNAAWGGFAWGDDPPYRIGTLGLPGLSPPLIGSLPPRVPGSPRDIMGLTWEGRELVTIGTTPASTMYLDHDGSIIEHLTAVDQLFPSASSMISRIEIEAALDAVAGSMGQTLARACLGPLGAKLSRALGLPALPEPSDAMRSWWIGDRISVQEMYFGGPGERITVVFASSEDELAGAVQLAAAL